MSIASLLGNAQKFYKWTNPSILKETNKNNIDKLFYFTYIWLGFPSFSFQSFPQLFAYFLNKKNRAKEFTFSGWSLFYFLISKQLIHFYMKIFGFFFTTRMTCIIAQMFSSLGKLIQRSQAKYIIFFCLFQMVCIYASVVTQLREGKTLSVTYFGKAFIAFTGFGGESISQIWCK